MAITFFTDLQPVVQPPSLFSTSKRQKTSKFKRRVATKTTTTLFKRVARTNQKCRRLYFSTLNYDFSTTTSLRCSVGIRRIFSTKIGRPH